jgi:hypothetical protein
MLMLCAWACCIRWCNIMLRFSYGEAGSASKFVSIACTLASYWGEFHATTCVWICCVRIVYDKTWGQNKMCLFHYKGTLVKWIPLSIPLVPLHKSNFAKDIFSFKIKNIEADNSVMITIVVRLKSFSYADMCQDNDIVCGTITTYMLLWAERFSYTRKCAHRCREYRIGEGEWERELHGCCSVRSQLFEG